MLPGRGPIFRSFTWKLVTGQGALVGIQGTSRAKIWNSGLGALQLRNLPVKGLSCWASVIDVVDGGLWLCYLLLVSVRIVRLCKVLYLCHVQCSVKS